MTSTEPADAQKLGASPLVGPGDMNTCCNSLVDKIGEQMKRSGCLIAENKVLVMPCVRLWRKDGLVSVLLFLARFFLVMWQEVLRGWNGGSTDWTGSRSSRVLGMVYRTTEFVEERVMARHFKSRWSAVEDEMLAEASFMARVGEASVFTRETVLLWWGLAATSVCNRLPAINFDEEKLTRLGEWFSQTIGAPSNVFSRLSNIYSGRCAK